MTDKLKIEIIPVEAPEAEPLLLGDLEPGTVVRLADGVTALVAGSNNAVKDSLASNGRCLLLLTSASGNTWYTMGHCCAIDAIRGISVGRIVKVIGKLKGITVQP